MSDDKLNQNDEDSQNLAENPKNLEDQDNLGDEETQGYVRGMAGFSKFNRCLLKIVEGPDTGKSVLFDVTPSSVGSLDTCNFVVTDPEVKALHFELGYDFDKKSWYVHMPQGSQVAIDSHEASDYELLAHGALIEFGNTCARFLLQEGDAPKKIDKKSELELSQEETHNKNYQDELFTKNMANKEHKKKKFGLLFLGALIGIAVVLVVFGEGVFSDSKTSALSNPSKLVAQAKTYLASGNLEEASKLVSEVLAANALNPQALLLKTKLNQEESARKYYEKALKLSQAGKHLAAEKSIEQIHKTSIFYDEAKELHEKIKRDIVAQALNQVADLEKEGDILSAIKLLSPFVTRDPDNEALELRMNGLIKENNLFESFKRKAVTLLKEQNYLALNGLCESYTKKDLKQAAVYQANIERFKASLDAGVKNLAEREALQAVENFKIAYELVDKISFGKETGLSAKVEKYYANALYLDGFTLKEAGKICASAKSFWKALELQPNDKKVIAQTNELTAKATGLYQKALGLKQTNASADITAIVKTALCLVPSGSDTAKSLQGLL